jgi:hypothetical protein
MNVLKKKRTVQIVLKILLELILLFAIVHQDILKIQIEFVKNVI